MTALAVADDGAMDGSAKALRDRVARAVKARACTIRMIAPILIFDMYNGPGAGFQKNRRMLYRSTVFHIAASLMCGE